MGKFVELELDRETVEMFEEIKKHLGIEDDAKALRYIISYFISKRMRAKILDAFEREEIEIPKIVKRYQLKNVRFFDGGEWVELNSWVGFNLDRFREVLKIQGYDDVKTVEIELSDAPPLIGVPKLILRFELVDGGWFEIQLWYDSAKKLVEFINEALDILEKEACSKKVKA